VIVLTARQADMACAMTDDASFAGAPGPEGNFISGAPHDAASSTATSAALARSRPKGFTS
jgi:hypothetical protein